MTGPRGYAEQARHYFFERPQDEVRRIPLDVDAAWCGADQREASWRYVLNATEREEVRAAVRHAVGTGKPMGGLGTSDLPLPTLAKRFGGWRADLDRGRGFMVVSGVPVEDWTDEEAGIFFWGFGLHLGRPGAQNVAGDLLGHVVDTGEDAADPFVRRYRTAGDIAFHCDAADVVGLLCLRSARRGGKSRIASSVTIYNQLLEERPDLVDRLYEPFCLDLRNEVREGQGWVPVTPCRYAEGALRTFYHSDYFRSVVRHDDVPPFTKAEQELLDLYEEIAARPEIHLDMDLAPGDVQLLSNHTIVHARTAYEDAPGDGARGRHLLRLWLSLERG